MAELIISVGAVLTKVVAITLILASCVAIYLVESCNIKTEA